MFVSPPWCRTTTTGGCLIAIHKVRSAFESETTAKMDVVCACGTGRLPPPTNRNGFKEILLVNKTILFMIITSWLWQETLHNNKHRVRTTSAAPETIENFSPFHFIIMQEHRCHCNTDAHSRTHKRCQIYLKRVEYRR